MSLEELWLGKNKIAALEPLPLLPKLQILSLPSNRLTILPQSLPLPSLQELYVSHNAIRSLPSFASTPHLRILDISSNQIAHLENLAPLKELEELWASDNLLDSFEELELELANKDGMQTVYLERNPLQRKAGVNYRNKVRLAIPRIKQIDASEYSLSPTMRQPKHSR